MGINGRAGNLSITYFAMMLFNLQSSPSLTNATNCKIIIFFTALSMIEELYH